MTADGATSSLPRVPAKVSFTKPTAVAQAQRHESLFMPPKRPEANNSPRKYHLATGRLYFAVSNALLEAVVNPADLVLSPNGT